MWSLKKKKDLTVLHSPCTESSDISKEWEEEGGKKSLCSYKFHMNPYEFNKNNNNLA